MAYTALGNTKGDLIRHDILAAIQMLRDRLGCAPTLEEIAYVVQRSKSNTYYHLRLLTAAGFVKETPTRTRGAWTLCRLDEPPQAPGDYDANGRRGSLAEHAQRVAELDSIPRCRMRRNGRRGRPKRLTGKTQEAQV